jgi:hypothetical protein
MSACSPLDFISAEEALRGGNKARIERDITTPRRVWVFNRTQADQSEPISSINDAVNNAVNDAANEALAPGFETIGKAGRGRLFPFVALW